uniref:flagellar protein FlaG n=1 Tax=Sulfurihydrogenibium sp. TaxID=2053621 RepID=UPI00261DEC40
LLHFSFKFCYLSWFVLKLFKLEIRVKIVDVETNKVIKQIPPDYIINIIKNINKMLGALFNEKI